MNTIPTGLADLTTAFSCEKLRLLFFYYTSKIKTEEQKGEEICPRPHINKCLCTLS